MDVTLMMINRRVGCVRHKRFVGLLATSSGSERNKIPHKERRCGCRDPSGRNCSFNSPILEKEKGFASG